MNSKFKIQNSRLVYILLLFWLAVLPWHAFLKTWFSALFLGSNADFLPAVSNILSLWKEILLFILLIVFFFIVFKSKDFWQQLRTGPFLWLGAFLLSMLIFAGIKSPSLTALILGIRTDFLFIPALLLGIFIAQSLDSKKLYKLFQVGIISLTVAAGIGIFSWLFFPNIGLSFGYSPYQSSFVENKPLPVYHCLFIDEQCIPRLQATFSGPNQAASLMILLLGLLIATTNFKVITDYFKLIIPFVGLLLTFSRSAILGAIAGSVILLPRKIFLIGLGIIVIISTGIFVIKADLITHGLSSLEHWDKTITGITRVIEKPLGTGFGSAGPVSRRLLGEENALISENWYLQIGEEGGIIPALLFVIFLGSLIYTLLKKSDTFSKTMAYVLLATSIQAFFLHLWEDSVVTMLIWFFVGLAFISQKVPPNHQEHHIHHALRGENVHPDH